VKKKTKHYHAGWDHFTPDPGTQEKMFCIVCDAEMDVKRNVNGATSWAESMGRGKHLHDSFSCPNVGKGWHSQVRILKERIEKESSQSIAEILEKELKVVLETKKTTRKRPWEYL
jgi:hypothetical protein